MTILKEKVPDKVYVSFIYIYKEEIGDKFKQEFKKYASEMSSNNTTYPNINAIHVNQRKNIHSRNLDLLYKNTISKKNIKESYLNKEEMKKNEGVDSISPSLTKKRESYKRLHKELKYNYNTQVNKSIERDKVCPNKIKISMNLPTKKNAISNISSSLNEMNSNKHEKSKKVVIHKKPKNYVFNPSLIGYLNKNKQIEERNKKMNEVRKDKAQEKSKANIILSKEKDKVLNPSAGKIKNISPCPKPLASEIKEKEIIVKYIHQNKLLKKIKDQKPENNEKAINEENKKPSMKNLGKNIVSNVSNEPTNINSSQRNEVSNHQSLDYLREVKLNIEDNLRNLLNFSYENFMSKEKDNSDIFAGKSFEKSYLNFSNDQSINKENQLDETVNQYRNSIQYTGEINLDQFDDKIRNIVFRKINK